MHDNFLIVYRCGSKFIQLETESEARGLRPDEAWVFGQPVMPGEYRLWCAAEPAVAMLDGDRVHRIRIPAAQLTRGMSGDVFVDEFAFRRKERR